MKHVSPHIDQQHAEGERRTNRLLLKWSYGELGVSMHRKTMQAYLGLSWNNVKAKKRTLFSYQNDAIRKLLIRLDALTSRRLRRRPNYR
jgi:hypothetical protein